MTAEDEEEKMRRYPRIAAWLVATALAAAAVLAGAVASLGAGAASAGQVHPISLDAPDQEHNHNQVVLS
jgi:hypothetical protein